MIVQHIPQTLKTARKVFSGVETKTSTMAMCPKCCVIYPPSEYPPRCTAKEFPDSKMCDTNLLTYRSKRVRGETLSIPFPILPVEVNDFADWKAHWLQRPGMEEILRRSQADMGKSRNGDPMDDIRDGEGVRDLPHPDGGKFFDGRPRKELRTAWTFFSDAFNPYFNKAAGKTASSTVLGMACNNLPPSLKHQPENLFLVTVLPKDPSVDQVPFSLKVLFEELNQHWETGVYIANTPSSRNGFRERSIIANVVTDMIGGSKLGGHAQHNSAKYFCDLCLLQKPEINCVKPTELPPRSKETEYANACRWRDATSKTERDNIFKETGTRWTALFFLLYYDPTRMLAADTMHNLFLGLVQHHCRIVMGIDSTKRSSNVPGAPVYDGFENPDMDSLAKGREKLGKTKSLKVIENLPKNILWMLCAEKGISLKDHAKTGTRKILANMLWVSTITTVHLDRILTVY